MSEATGIVERIKAATRKIDVIGLRHEMEQFSFISDKTKRRALREIKKCLRALETEK